MENCKFCGAELDENVTLCPACGKDNSQPPEALTDTAPGDRAEAPIFEAVPELDALPEEAPIFEDSASHTPEIQPGITTVTPGKLALAIAAVVLLLALLAGLLVMGMEKPAPETAPSTQPGESTLSEPTAATVPQNGDPNNATCKGSYTATDADTLAAKDTVVATLGDRELTNGQLQVYYWMGYHNFVNANYSYLTYLGLNPTMPLEMQPIDSALLAEGEPANTWQQFFLSNALLTWQQVQSMTTAAEEAEATLPQEDQDYLDTLADTLKTQAEAYGVTTEELLLRNVGPGATVEDFRQYQYAYLMGAAYYADEMSKLDPTDEELLAHFNDNAATFAASGVTLDADFINVRHILLDVQGGTTDENGVTTYSEEEWETCRQAAQAVLDEWLAGDQTEESFAELANKHSTDPGSNTTGGLYEDVLPGKMVVPFNDWCFDENRQYGDHDLVQTDYGYHVMFFVSREEDAWKQYARSDWSNLQSAAFMEEILSRDALQVSYDKILIGVLPTD